MENTGGMMRVAVEGELSIFSAVAIRQRLLDALGAGAEVEVDLSGVAEIDSAGVQLMVAAKREAAANGKSLRFVGHSAAVFDILELCDLGGHLGDPLVIQSRA